MRLPVATHTPHSRRVQAQVLQHAADGRNAQETAIVMNYSPETVRAYLKAALRTLGARNVTQAVAVAWRQGLIR